MTFYRFNRHTDRLRKYYGHETYENPYYHMFARKEAPVRPTLPQKVSMYSMTHTQHFFTETGPVKSDLHFKVPEHLQQRIGKMHMTKLKEFVRQVVMAKRYPARRHDPEFSYFIGKLLRHFPGPHIINDVQFSMEQILYSRSMLLIFLSKQFPYINVPIHYPLNQLDVEPFCSLPDKATFPLNTICIDGEFYFHVSPLTMYRYASVTTKTTQNFSSTMTPTLTL